MPEGEIAVEVKKRGRIPGHVAFLMYAVAFAIDILQGLLMLLFIGLFVNWLISVFAWLLFWLWFHIQGVDFFDKVLRFVVMAGASFLEILPFFNAIPTWTFMVILMVLIVRHEDRKYNKQLRHLLSA